MAISQAMCTSFKAELLLGVHDFRNTSGDTFKIALYTSSASLDSDTSAFTTSNEVSGTNYTSGGNDLDKVSATFPNTSGSTAFMDFEDETFSNVTITAAGALIYNSTPSAADKSNSSLTNPAVCVLNFGGDKSASSGNFKVVLPTGDVSNAIIRIA